MTRYAVNLQIVKSFNDNVIPKKSTSIFPTCSACAKGPLIKKLMKLLIRVRAKGWRLAQGSSSEADEVQNEADYNDKIGRRRGLWFFLVKTIALSLAQVGRPAVTGPKLVKRPSRVVIDFTSPHLALTPPDIPFHSNYVATDLGSAY